MDQPYQEILQRFSPVFTSNLGHRTQAETTLELKPSTKPIFRPKRPVPYAALPPEDRELKRPEEMKVTTPLTYSQWAGPIVAVKKAGGSIHLWADFSTGLKAALEDHRFQRISSPYSIVAPVFAKLDLTEAYLQIDVSTASRELLTINTHHGLFQYTRLPFRVKTAPAIFLQIIDTMLTKVEGVAAYLDDIIVVGRSDGTDQQSSDAHSRLWFPPSTRSIIFTYSQLNTWDSFSTAMFIV